MKTVKCLAIGAISVCCLAAQTPPKTPAQPEAKQKQETPESLPPGPLGLTVDNAGKTDAAGKPETEKNGTKPAADAADPSTMAAPPSDGSKGKIAGAAAVNTKTYIIGAEDQLGIQVWGHADLSSQVVVRPDGRFSLPLVGDVQAAGRSPEQLAKDIEEKLKEAKILLDPNVTVAVLGIHSKKYFIEGEVNHTGSFDLTVPTTVMQGLVNAGGFRDFAKKNKIVILRDGGKTILRFNYNDVSKGKHLDQNIFLEPGDHIIIR